MLRFLIIRILNYIEVFIGGPWSSVWSSLSTKSSILTPLSTLYLVSMSSTYSFIMRLFIYNFAHNASSCKLNVGTFSWWYTRRVEAKHFRIHRTLLLSVPSVILNLKIMKSKYLYTITEVFYLTILVAKLTNRQDNQQFFQVCVGLILPAVLFYSHDFMKNEKKQFPITYWAAQLFIRCAVVSILSFEDEVLRDTDQPALCSF